MTNLLNMLLKKKKELGNKLKDKLDPTNRSISIKDIDDKIASLLFNLDNEDFGYKIDEKFI